MACRHHVENKPEYLYERAGKQRRYEIRLESTFRASSGTLCWLLSRMYMCECVNGQGQTHKLSHNDQREKTTAGQNLKINNDHRFYRAELNTVLKHTSGQICLINKKAAFLLFIRQDFCKVTHSHGRVRGLRSQH